MGDKLYCYTCGCRDFDLENGFYYCKNCYTEAEGIAETGQEEGNKDSKSRGHPLTEKKVKPQNNNQFGTLLSQLPTQESQAGNYEYKIPKEEIDDSEPFGTNDFGGAPETLSLDSDVFSSEIRMRYVLGVQLMIQLQCQALVEKFGVSPLICGLFGEIWLRFVAVSRVFDDKWADDTIEESELQSQDDPEDFKPRSQYRNEPFNTCGQRAVLIWFRSLRKKLPVSASLAVSFLACHVAREPILPTDILKWAREGKLPYLTAFMDIEEYIKCHTTTSTKDPCPLAASYMFRPLHVVKSNELESQAGSIAHCIGLQLPPVNFHAIARRYLNHLSLPVGRILPHASRIHEWSTPPDLWLSANSDRLPSRVCVMSILVIAIRILYNLNGFGKWEESLRSSESSKSCGGVEKSRLQCKSSKSKGNDMQCPLPSESINKSGTTVKSRKWNKSAKVPPTKLDNKSDAHKNFPSRNFHCMGTLRGFSSSQSTEHDAAQLLCRLETTYEKLCDTDEYSKDLQTYLNFCKDVVFTGSNPTIDDTEEKLIEQLWKFYENQEDSEADVGCTRWPVQEESQDEGCVCADSRNDTELGDNKCNSSTSLDKNAATKKKFDEDGCSPSQQEEPTLRLTDCASAGSLRDEELKKMKLNMEENGFLYIPPRVNLKRFDYLHYIRKNKDGSRTYVSHADYYILLRACARVAQVDVQYMHDAVLRLEKRLAWIENRIDQSLHWKTQNCTPEPNPGAESEKDIHDLDLSSYKFVM